MGWGDWFVLNHSEEKQFKREVFIRHLRKLPPDQLLGTAETMLHQWVDTSQLLSQAIKRVAELEMQAAVRDEPAGDAWRAQLAAELLRPRE